MRRLACTLALLVVASWLRPSVARAQSDAMLVIDSATIAESGARTLAELLAARVPGVDVTWLSGAPGFAAHVSVRGAVGGTGSGRPDLYVDGVLLRDDQIRRVDRPDGQRPAHHWDLPVEEIQEVRVVLGASGGAFLELGASRGAVVVTTKRSRDGAWTFGATGTVTRFEASPPVPSLRTRSGTLAGGGDTNVCSIYLEASGGCTPISTMTLRPFRGDNPFGSAVAGRIAMSAGGAAFGGRARLGVVGDAEPGALGERFDRLDLSAALERDFGDRIRVAGDLRGSVVDGAYNGYEQLRFVGSAMRLGPDSGFGTPGQSSSELIEGERKSYSHQRAQARLAAQIRVGRADRVELGLTTDQYSRDLLREFGNQPRLDRGAVTLSAAYRAERRVARGLAASLRAAAWHQRVDAEEEDFPAVTRSKLEMTTLVLGAGLLSKGTRRLDAALRVESVADFSAWPASGSPLAFVSSTWALTDEPWMPRIPILPSWRLGLSYGESTDQQSLQDALYAQLEGGSAGVSAERALEREMSIEAQRAGGDLRLVARLFERRVTGSHMDVPISSTMGFSQLLQPNIPLETSGGELALSLKRSLPAGRSVEAKIWAARTRTRFGQLTTPDAYFRFGFLELSSGVGSGRLYGGIPTFTLTTNDLNGDQVISSGEVSVTGVSATRASAPTHILGLTLATRSVTGWSAGLTLDGKWGHHRYDAEAASRCVLRLCDEIFDPETPLRRQAEIAAVLTPSFDASFLRLREIWLRRRFASTPYGDIAVSLVGQQLLTVSRHAWRDPEVTSYHRPGIAEGQSFQEPVRPTLLLRVDIGAQ